MASLAVWAFLVNLIAPCPTSGFLVNRELVRANSGIGYISFAYSDFASVWIGMSASASFQRVRKSLYAASALTRAASASALVEFFACNAFARATPSRASAPVQQFQTMPLWSRIFRNSAAASLPCLAARYACPRM